jgi:preprotein translocase SecE subunit
MTMAVVEQQAPEQLPQSPPMQLGLSSLLGAALTLFCICFVLGGLPTMWETIFHVAEDVAAQRPPIINEFLSGALLLIVMILVGTGLFWFLRRTEQAASQPGLRAGVFFGSVAIYLVLGLSTKLGWTMMPTEYLEEANPISIGATIVVFAFMAFCVWWLFTRPGFARWLVGVESNGWFHAISYKGNQGVRVRRGTIVALLTVFVCGIITLVSHRTLGSPRPDSPNIALRSNSWLWEFPFTTTESGTLYLPIMHQIHITIPILLGLGSLWVAWRVVNWPAFADFLIATEAEMNKVSWTTRRRLMQDTVVVLVTVFLFTAYLFIVDIIWIKVLTNPWIGVLQVDIKSEVQKQQEKTQW